MMQRAVRSSLLCLRDISNRAKFSTVVESIPTPQPESNIYENYVPEVDEKGRIYATGRKKTSVARVWLKEGSGQFVVNDMPMFKYFQSLQRMDTVEPFIITDTAGCYDVWCTVKGGGISGQARAIRLGISRALNLFNPLLRTTLKRAGMMTRDPRMVERKKTGQHKARKKYQWVKR
eukprot:gene9315-12551_t